MITLPVHNIKTAMIINDLIKILYHMKNSVYNTNKWTLLHLNLLKIRIFIILQKLILKNKFSNKYFSFSIMFSVCNQKFTFCHNVTNLLLTTRKGEKRMTIRLMHTLTNSTFLLLSDLFIKVYRYFFLISFILYSYI